MARMIPDAPAPGTESRVELRTFERLRDETDAAFVAFHHVAWLVPSARGAPAQGEADFVVAHPKLGVAVLEVKGGGIGFDATTGNWHSRGRDGSHVIKDPFDQARRSSFRLRDALRMAKRSSLTEVTV